MLDLLVSLAIMTGFGLLAGIAGASLQRRASQSGRSRVIVVMAQLFATVGMLAYLNWVWDRPILARLFPFSAAIILGNWLPVAGAFFAGICAFTDHISIHRRAVFVSSLVFLSCYSLVSPLLGQAPDCEVSVNTQQLLEPQTTDHTCSAACAAGLLKMHGIHATEEELSELCLTRRGTHWLGVYRGLKLKTAGTEWDVVVEEISGADLLTHRNLQGILALSFVCDEMDSLETGFGTDVGHTVISFGVTSVRTLGVFDPSPDFGFESWNSRIIDGVDKAILLRLVSRHGSPSPLTQIDAHRPSTWNHVTSASEFMKLPSVTMASQSRY